ncbi:phospholipase D family protein [Cognatilysobacter segetis]|uniref:phospholipase D family protein n=1 Tax=Cognatilysobacter segetis TaxID=2492394 RepID=UPI00105FB3B6|nr:phospholipase D family protein [Lysobacter segetis]
MKTKVITDVDSLYIALEALFAWADRVDMCFAWVNSGQGKGRHWQTMQLGKVGRAVIGTAFAQTEPSALEVLDKKPDRLRLMINSEGTFHPKVISGRKGNRAKAIVGSANFTTAAYTSNTELCVLLDGSTDDSELDALQTFIDEQWMLGTRLSPTWLEQYRQVWESARRKKITVPGAKLEISSISSLSMSWEAYVSLIDAQHERPLADGNKVRVFGEHPSYLYELDEAERIFRDQPKFAAISRPDRQFLMGMGRSSGFIGTMRAAGFAKNIVYESPDAVGAALDRVPLDGPVSRGLIEDVIGKLTELKGVKIGVVSRLLAVKRPDLFVSVNNGSKPQLARLIGGKRVDTVGQYLALLDHVWSTEWYTAGEPKDSREVTIWRRRAALLDSALYEQV